MRTAVMTRRVALTGALLTASCTVEIPIISSDPIVVPEGTEATVQPPEISFADASSLGVVLEERGGELVPEWTALFGQRLINYRSDPVQITNMELIADPGLVATYLGHSTCEAGCPGTMAFENPSAQRMLRESIDGLYPINIEPQSLERTLVFKLELDGATGVSELLSRCDMYVRSVLLTLDDGSKVEVSHISEYVVGLRLDTPLPAGANNCEPRGEPGSFQEPRPR